MDAPNPSSVRVLLRPPPQPKHASPSSSSSQPHRPSTTPSSDPSSSSSPSTAQATPSPQHRPPDGVVAVGFVGRRLDDVSQLINRVIDSNVFGSGNLDNTFWVDKEGVRDWFRRRRISYYHEEEKGILFLQFSSTRCPAIDGFSEPSPGFDSAVEEHEFGDLQGMLFMFSVCHVIIYIQEGSRFNSSVLKNFRVLQAAKHALSPFVRSLNIPSSLPSRPHSSSSSRVTSSATSPSRRGGSVLTHSASAVSLMSGLGSYTSLFPGQCNPVTLFVFIDDFTDIPTSSANAEDCADTSSLNQSSSLNSLARTNLPARGSGSVVVLARPGSKSEGGLRKKLQSSLEAQIRFLIKKCRTLSGLETGHSGGRSGGTSSSAPLFSLDSSRAVVLLDCLSNRSGESLDFATGLVEDVLNGKAASDSLLLESHAQSTNEEDILSIKEFINRQSDILRGRGGLVNPSSASAAGVGMVAAAAAAAAASAASRKTFTAPELPSLEVWLSSCKLILQGVLLGKGGCIDESEMIKRKMRPRKTGPPAVEGSLKSRNPFDVAVSWLQSGRGLNTKFSTLWCERALPAAKEVYLKDLPACYSTSQHDAHLEKALHAFRTMVKGPAVQQFVKRLENECTSIWKSGRQLCDAVSLTGKPCMHQRHDVVKSHCSGYFFLHACACGRSRQLQSDPFDFESANNNSSCFLDCDKLLPSLKLPDINTSGPVQPSSWSLLRIGGAKYYEPSKGLLQSGFCPTEKFLLRLIIYLEKQNNPNGLKGLVQQDSVNCLSKFEPGACDDIKRNSAIQPYPGVVHNELEDQRISLNNINSDDKKISFGKGLPNVQMRKPFSEVVAGSASVGSGFPPLQQKKLPSLDADKSIKQSSVRDTSVEPIHPTTEHQVARKSPDISFVQAARNCFGVNSCTDGDPFLRIGSNVVPVNANGGEMLKPKYTSKHATVYVGFENECPHGHRFLLNPEHLNGLGSSYSLPQDFPVTPSMEPSDNNLAHPPKTSKGARRGKVHRPSNGMIAPSMNREMDVNKSKERIANSNTDMEGKVNQTPSNLLTKPSDFMKGQERDLQSFSIDDGGCTFSMLGRNLPIYMNCPYCKLSKNKKNPPKVKFASSISQLQRIFLVTPPLPVILATCPAIQFESSCLPPSVPQHERNLQFNLGCPVILPPDSFLTLRLPFIYGVQLEDGSEHPLQPFEHQPELTAWITRGSVLQILSKGSNLDVAYQTQ